MKNSKSFIFLFAFILLMTSMPIITRKLKTHLVILLGRHGSRTHIANPNNKYSSYLTDVEGFPKGALTPNGYSQYFLLGKQLVKEYPHLLSGSYNPRKHFFKSTNRERTIQSSIALFNGIFDINRVPKLAKPLGRPSTLPPWKDIDFKSLVDEDSLEFDLDLRKLEKHPDYIEIERDLDKEYTLRAHKTPEFKKLINYHKKDIDGYFNDILKSKTFKELHPKFDEYGNEERISDSDYLLATDYFVSEHHNHANLESPFSKEFMDMVSLVNHGKHIKRYINPIVSKALCSPLMSFIRSKIRERVYVERRQKDEEKLGFISLLSHDTVLTPLLLTFGHKNFDKVTEGIKTSKRPEGYVGKPDFASNLIFEVLEDDISRFFIRVRYNGEYISFCNYESREDDKHTCTLEEFYKTVSNKIFEDWEGFLKSYHQAELIEDWDDDL